MRGAYFSGAASLGAPVVPPFAQAVFRSGDSGICQELTARLGGGDCYRVLRREPMLSSRVYVWQEFRRLSRAEILQVVPAFHPVWADADPDVISFADAHAGHGNFRAWAKITSHVVTGLARLGRPSPDEDVLRWVFSRLGGHQP